MSFPSPCIGTKDQVPASTFVRLIALKAGVCIDCGAWASACPIEAIYAEADVPATREAFIEIPADYYRRPSNQEAINDSR